MKHNRISKTKKWFVFAIAIASAGICVAQTKPPTKPEQPLRQQQNQAQFPKFSMAIIEGARIDPGYTGMPMAEIIDAIEKMNWGLKKGEFESTADYNARRAAALSRTFLGDLSLQD